MGNIKNFIILAHQMNLSILLKDLNFIDKSDAGYTAKSMSAKAVKVRPTVINSNLQVVTSVPSSAGKRYTNGSAFMPVDEVHKMKCGIKTIYA